MGIRRSLTNSIRNFIVTNITELRNHRLEYCHLGLDLFKWVVGGIVIIIGFMWIRPHEQERLDKALQLEVHKAYLSATDTENIDLWQRKLDLLSAITDEKDKKMIAFIDKERKRIKDIRTEKENIVAARQQQADAKKDIEVAKKQYAEIKAKYEKLAKESSLEKNQVEEEKKALEERISLLEAKQANAVKVEKTSAEALKNYGMGGVATLQGQVITTTVGNVKAEGSGGGVAGGSAGVKTERAP
jgi:hypothetical protein